MRIRVLLLERSACVREAMRALLDADDGVEVVAEATDFETAQTLMATTQPDVLLAACPCVTDIVPTAQGAARQKPVIVVYGGGGWSRPATPPPGAEVIPPEARPDEILRLLRLAAG